MPHNYNNDEGISAVISQIAMGIALRSTKYNHNYNGKPYRPIVRLSQLLEHDLSNKGMQAISAGAEKPDS